jgi:beta-lactamase regulating signal transducer with metallopeptidase domain
MNAAPLLPCVEILGKSILLLAIGFLLALGLKQVSAANRHCLWLAVFMALILLPLTKWAHPVWAFSFASSKATTAPLVASTAAVPQTSVIAKGVKATPGWQLPNEAEAAFVLWLGGVGLLLIYRLLGASQLSRLLRRSAAAGEGLRRIAADVAAELGVRRKVKIQLSGDCPVPMTWGVGRPVVLLPMAAEDWSWERQRAALIHEMAHIARGDYFSRGIAQIACVIYWPNPLVWLAARRLRAEQELACDDVMLRHGTPAPNYATQLVEAAQHLMSRRNGCHQALTMAQPSTLQSRVRALVDEKRSRTPAGPWILAAAVMASLAMLCASAVAQIAESSKSPTLAAKTTPPAQPEDASMVKARKIVIPEINFHDTSLSDAVKFLRQQAVELDAEPDVSKRGINIFIKLPGNDAPLPQVSLRRNNISLAEALREVAALAGFQLKAGSGRGGGAILLLPPDSASAVIETTQDTFDRRLLRPTGKEFVPQMTEAEITMFPLIKFSESLRRGLVVTLENENDARVLQSP